MQWKPGINALWVLGAWEQDSPSPVRSSRVCDPVSSARAGTRLSSVPVAHPQPEHGTGTDWESVPME